MGNRIVAVVFSVCMLLGELACSNQPLQTAGGTGSELIGNVRYGKGPVSHPAADAEVYIFDESYLSDTSRSSEAQWAVTTDENGTFRIPDLAAGTYIVEAVDDSGRSIAARAVVPKDEIVSLDTLFVTVPGAIRMPFRWTLPANEGARWYVRIYGTRHVFHGIVDSAETLMADIPTGIPLSFNLLIPGPVPVNLDFNGISVVPDSTRILPALLLNSPLP